MFRLMQKRKMPRDSNQLAARIVALTTSGEEEPEEKAERAPSPQKNPAAVALGRLGGLKGGAASPAAMASRMRPARSGCGARRGLSGSQRVIMCVLGWAFIDRLMVK